MKEARMQNKYESRELRLLQSADYPEMYEIYWHEEFIGTYYPDNKLLSIDKEEIEDQVARLLRERFNIPVESFSH